MSMRYLFLIFSTLVFISCEREVDFKLDTATEKLVVEATIENGQPPVVILSKSQNYFSKITPEILVNSFVRNAEVFVSNGLLTHKLKEYPVATPLGNIYYYSIDSANLSTAFVGQFNQSYSLKIVYNAQEYTANTTIPALTKIIDTLRWEKAPFTPDTSKRVVIKATVTDPPLFGNYIRYFTKVNSENFLPGENSVFDDQIVNGTTYTVDVERGQDRNNPREGDDKVFYRRGDTVTVKYCNIDKATYEFWRTMEFSYASIGNPFSSPTKILSNISNNALGYFGGYACQYKKIIIPQ